jgi:outer membrane protein TolC
MIHAAALALIVYAIGDGHAPYGVDDCVNTALQTNARLGEGEAQVREYAARLQQVESMFALHVQGIAVAAPMYTVHGDIFHFDNSWKSPSDWGPYAHLVATLSRPLYTFGRKEAALTAASEREAVAEARLRETRNVVAWETRKLYYMLLFARSLVPS